jgi:glycosyltransferase involved in cell wall biosynthesis/ribosomal protein S18 acetylase RimI-like enzyme
MNGGPRVAHVTTVDLTLRFLLLGQLRRLRGEGYQVTGISAPGPWTEDLEAEGIRHIPWPHATRAWSPGDDARAFAELMGILRRERFDVVHTHNPKPGVMGRIAARMVGVPAVVNTVHGLYATPEDRLVKRFSVLGLERLAARFSHMELYQSEEDLRWARRIGLVRSGRSLLLGNGTDLIRFDPQGEGAERGRRVREELGFRQDEVVVGAVGRLVAENAYRQFFAAARQVRRAFPEVRFLVAGSADADKADAISEQEMARARDDVLFVGWSEDVPGLLSAMDVFVLASWREGVPRSAIEAAAMARPLVLTDIRGCREVARDGIEGVLVRPRDPDGLAEAIRRLVANPDLRARLGAAARARATARFDERRVAQTVVSSYRRLLGPRASADPTSGGFQVRPADRGDVAAVSRLHRQALPDAFLPSLGDAFLRRLYRAMTADRGSVVLVAENGSGVIGFAAGTVSVRSFYRLFLRRYGPGAALVAAPRLIRPAVLRRVRETARYPTTVAGAPESELLSIAVAPGHESKGVGRALAWDLLRGLAKRGADEVKVVVAAENQRANGFYEKAGFRQVGHLELHGGSLSNVWVIRTVGKPAALSGSR